MNGCEEYELLLSAQLDNQLSPQEAGTLEEHLATCPHCRALQAELALIHQEAGRLTWEPPASLTENMMAQVRREPRAVTPLLSSRSHRRWTRFLASAAVLALIVAGASYGGLFSNRGKQAAPETISTQGSNDHASLPQEQEKEKMETGDQALAPPQESGGSAAYSAPAPDPQPANPSVPEDGPYGTAPASPESDGVSKAQSPIPDQEPTQRSFMAGSGDARSSDDGISALESVTLTQAEAQERLVAYLDESAIAYTSLEYLGTCQGEAGYLFTTQDQNGEANTYWVSLEDGTVSPVSGLEKTPGE